MSYHDQLMDEIVTQTSNVSLDDTAPPRYELRLDTMQHPIIRHTRVQSETEPRVISSRTRSPIYSLRGSPSNSSSYSSSPAQTPRQRSSSAASGSAAAYDRFSNIMSDPNTLSPSSPTKRRQLDRGRPDSSEFYNEIAEYKSQIEAYERENKQLHDRLITKDTVYSSTQKKLQQTTDELKQTTDELQQANTEIENLRAQLQEAHHPISDDDLQYDLDVLKSQLSGNIIIVKDFDLQKNISKYEAMYEELKEKEGQNHAYKTVHKHYIGVIDTIGRAKNELKAAIVKIARNCAIFYGGEVALKRLSVPKQKKYTFDTNVSGDTKFD